MQELDLDAVIAEASGTQNTTEELYDPAVKAKAYEQYLRSDLTLEEIALDARVAVAVVADWAQRGKWRQRRKALELELLQRAEDSYRKFLVTTRQPVVERHLRISAKIEAKIEELLDAGDELNAVTLRRLSEALASATGISARAAAINDRALEIIDREDGQGRRGGQSGKIPLVALGVSVNVAHNPGDAAPTVNITAEELPRDQESEKPE